MVIVRHFSGSVKDYIAASQAPGGVFALPDCCPHPDCQARQALIRWGTYQRGVATGEGDYSLRIQRIRCKVCGRTHSLLPDFLHPHRHYVISLLQYVTALYILVGLGWRRLLQRLPAQGPARSTVREWVTSFGYGAGHLLLSALLRYLLALDPDAAPPEAPDHLRRVPDPAQRRRLGQAYAFWYLAERLYAQVKARQPRLHFTADQLFPFLLHWCQQQGFPARLLWSPLLATTPTQPFGR